MNRTWGRAISRTRQNLFKKTADVVENLECTFMNMPEMNCWYEQKKIYEDFGDTL